MGRRTSPPLVITSSHRPLITAARLRVARGPFEGYFSAIIEEADDVLNIQYFKEKLHGKYWVLAESENEKEWRPRSDLGKIEPDIDWRGRFAFE